MTNLHGSDASDGSTVEMPAKAATAATSSRNATKSKNGKATSSDKSAKFAAKAVDNFESRSHNQRQPLESSRGKAIVRRRLGVDDLLGPLIDPAGSDVLTDRVMATSLRRMGRVATVAAEVGARFARERIDVDPVAWLAAPRRLFGGASAIVAVQSQVHFHRAMVLHGLSLGFDAEPGEIDDLANDGGDGDDDVDFGAADADADVDTAAAAGVVTGAVPGTVPVSDTAVGDDPSLYTAVVIDVTGRGSLFVFHARLARSRTDFEDGLRLRLGAVLADAAHICEGYDPGDPVAVALVSGALDDTLRQADRDPASPIAAGLDIFLEQRFAD